MKTQAAVWASGFALGALGFSCIITQLVLVRECLASFSGNEILLGIVLGCWLLLMGLGSALGNFAQRLKQPARALAGLLMLLAVIAPAQVLAWRVLRNVVFTRGAEVGITETVTACGLLLLPYGVLGGFALSLGSTLLARNRGATGAGLGYIMDSLGTILGGLVFSLVLVNWLDHYRTLLVPAVLSFAAAAALEISCGSKRFAVLPLALGMGIVLLFSLLDLDGFSTRMQYPGQRVLSRANSPYGRLVVTESGSQINFIENGVALTSTRDDQHVEETVHYALCQRPEARRVLLISGGISGSTLEALRYEGVRVDYVELDPLVLELGRTYVPKVLSDPRLQVINTDARVHLKQACARYDAIIVDLPAPSTAQLNRFYTVEFMAQAKHALRPGGLLSYALGQYENYVSPELSRMWSCARNTTRSIFTNSLVIPGGQVFFLGSDGPLSSNIAGRVEACGLKHKLVGGHYLEGMLTADRVAQLEEASSQSAPLNRDLSPRLYYLHLKHWMSQFSPTAAVVPALCVAALVAYLVRLRRGRLALFASGFAGSALELVLLLGFQVLCGSVYYQVALIVTAFMIGLATGAWLSNRAGAGGSPGNPRHALAWLAFALALYALALPFLLRAMSAFGLSAAALWGIRTLLSVLAAGLGAAISAQFPLANRIDAQAPEKVLARLYTADFIGAFVGAAVAGTMLIPLVGVFGVCLVTAVLNLAAGFVVLAGNRHAPAGMQLPA